MSRWNHIIRLLLPGLLLLPAGSAFGYEIVQPQSLDDILQVIDTEIPNELEAMQCGGWVGESILGSAQGEDPQEFIPDGQGYITRVEGVPGREGRPLGDVPSGMAVRVEEGGNEQFNDGYIYPDDAYGLSTRCPTGADTISKLVWSYDTATWMDEIDADTLYFEDPPCVWRPGHTITSPHSEATCQQFCDILNFGENFDFRYQYADCYKIVGGMGSLEPNDEDHLDEDGNEDPNKQELTCDLWCLKNVCTDGWTTLCHPSLEALTRGKFEDAPTQPDGLPDPEPPEVDENGMIEIESKHPNCSECEGEECRCGYQDALELLKRGDRGEKIPACALNVPDDDIGVPGDLSELSEYSKKVVLGCRLIAMEQMIAEEDIALDPEECVARFEEEAGGGDPEESYKEVDRNLIPGHYASFYRDYEARYSREALTGVAPDDAAEGAALVACYGFYREVDHKEFRLIPKEEAPDGIGGDKYRRCVINIDLMSRHETQTGKGEYGQNTEIVDEPREPRGEFLPSADVWYRMMDGFSFLNTQKTTDVAKGLLQLDDAALKAVMPVARMTDGELDERPRPPGGRSHAFDDTGGARSIVTWWQTVQNQAADLAIPSTVHVLLPPTWPLGLDPEAAQNDQAEQAADAQERRLQPVDVQINAARGVLDEVVRILQSGLLFRLDERRVAIAVFSAAPEDLRALADTHCLRAMQDTGKKSCGAALAERPEAARIRDQLLKYADVADESRLLRTELASYVAQLLATQNDLLEPVEKWLDEYRERYEKFIDEREKFLASLGILREIEKSMAQFPSLPFCLNLRFGTPIYSMLDPWLLSRDPDGGVLANSVPDEEKGLPDFGSVPRAADLVLDLSMLEVRPTKVQVPVLEPIVWRIDLRRFGPGQKTYPPLPDPPSLQPVRDALRSARATLPVICTPLSPATSCIAENPPRLELPNILAADQEESLKASVEEIRLKIEEMADVYGKFWQAAGPLYPDGAIDCETDERGEMTCFDERTGKRTAGTLDWWVKETGGPWSDTDKVVAALKPVLTCPNNASAGEWSCWKNMPCFFTENELIEEITRLTARPMAELDEDRASIGSARLFPASCMPEDEVCRKLPPENRPPAQGWQVESPKMDRALPDLEKRIRAIQLPSPLTDSSTLPPYDGVLEELPPALSMPDDDPIVPAAPSSAANR